MTKRSGGGDGATRGTVVPDTTGGTPKRQDWLQLKSGPAGFTPEAIRRRGAMVEQIKKRGRS